MKADQSITGSNQCTVFLPFDNGSDHMLTDETGLVTVWHIDACHANPQKKYWNVGWGHLRQEQSHQDNERPK